MLRLLLLLLIATPVLGEAPAPRQAELLAVWFDAEGAACFETTQDYEVVTAQVVISGMSHTLLEGYALGLTVVDDGGLFELDVTMEACAFNAASGLDFMTGAAPSPRRRPSRC